MLREMTLDSRSVRYLFIAINLCNGIGHTRRELYGCCIVAV